MSQAPNAAQAEYWNEAAGPIWAEMQGPLDRQLAPLGGLAISALAPIPGERILDIGCGAGDTSLELAAMVMPDGTVTGLDISRPLLEAARRRTAALPSLSFVEADAQTYAFEPAAYDAIFSRFGVMFFADPAAAFANLRRALKPGGRLAFVCWRTPAENEVMTLPMAAAAAFLPPPAPPEPGAPGPFAFADPERVRTILGSAGFADVSILPHDLRVGGGNLEATLSLSLRIGPLGAALRANPEQREAVVEAIRAALAPHEGSDGVKLQSATWVVTARNLG